MDCAETYTWYVAQEIPQIDAEIAEKGHFWMETSEVPPQTDEAFARDGHSPPSLRAVGSTSRKPGRRPYGAEARRYLSQRPRFNLK